MSEAPADLPGSVDTLLLATDWSEATEEVELHPRAAALAKRLDAEVVVVTAYDPPHPLRIKRGAPGLDEYRSEMEKEAEGIAAAATAQLINWGVKARAVAAEGHPDDVILRTAEEEDVDLIVVGGCSGASPSKYLVGSTVERVVRHSTVPVLVLK